MRAAVCRAFGEPLVIEELELAAPRAGELRVMLAACAICQSDIHYLSGAWGGPLPAVFGHEAAGIVAEIGADVDWFHGRRSRRRDADPVLWPLRRLAPAVSLRSARRAFPLDEHGPLTAPDGSTILQGLRTAAFAEEVVVDASQAVGIPHDIPLDSASLLACGVITGFGAVVNTAAVAAGESVAVIGTGGVGLNAVQGAVIAGATTVIAVDVVGGQARDRARLRSDPRDQLRRR